MRENDKFMDNYGAIYAASYFVLMNESNFTPAEIIHAKAFKETSSLEIKDRGYEPSSFPGNLDQAGTSNTHLDVKFLSSDGKTRYVVKGVSVLKMLEKLYPSFSLR